MKKKIFILVLALLMVISLVGCAEISLQHNTENSAPTQETSSDEQSATETWDSISDGETEATTQTEATQPTQIQETAEKEQKEPETTVPAEITPADTTPKPTTPAEKEDKPPAAEPPQTEKTPAKTKPSEEEKTSEENTSPPKEEEPQPSAPPETGMTATEPTEVIDTDVLISYGRSYAVSTYGYEASPGLRDGYYPAYSCRIRTMDEGYSAIRACVDDTTRALLARPGTQIVVEIDGIAHRARIDIVITAHGNGEYSVTVYYG